jgi:hypothetical protein
VGYFEEHSSQHLRDLGLGDHLLKQAKRKAKAVEKAALEKAKAVEKAAAVAFEMEVLTAVLKVPGITKKRKQKQSVAEQMIPAIPSGSSSYKQGKFHRAWKLHKHLHK